MNRTWQIFWSLLCGVLLVIPGDAQINDKTISTGESSMSLTLTSTSFQHRGDIPALYTCDGKGISPPLGWSGVPQGARSLALIVDDPDAPDPAKPRRIWVHWILYNLPATATELPEGVRARDLPAGAREGLNDGNRIGYGSPCPPIGKHRYFFKLYALDIVLPEIEKMTKAQLEKAMQGHIVAQTELVGLYQRPK